MLELLVHCHHLVAVEDARLGWPEVTLPVVPGMEGCHWPYRRATPAHWPRLTAMLLGGELVRAREAVGWLVDAAGPMDEALRAAWSLASGAGGRIPRRPLEAGRLAGVPLEVSGLPVADDPAVERARAAVAACIRDACGATLAEALEVQARHAAEFLASPGCRAGRVGAEAARTLNA
jgi:enoyl-CoA hydratase/carnithine racemase